MILVKRYANGPNALHYRHCDGYPLGLGVELIEALKQGLDTAEVLRKVGGEKEVGHPVGKVEDAFLKVQGDLEWIYTVNDYHSDIELRSLGIFKTSCPYSSRENGIPDFVFRCFWSYVKYLPADHQSKMEQVESIAETTLQALISLERRKLEEE
jgi:hypothetical protein